MHFYLFYNFFFLPYIIFIYSGGSKKINSFGSTSIVKLNTEDNQQVKLSCFWLSIINYSKLNKLNWLIRFLCLVNWNKCLVFDLNKYSLTYIFFSWLLTMALFLWLCQDPRGTSLQYRIMELTTFLNLKTMKMIEGMFLYLWSLTTKELHSEIYEFKTISCKNVLRELLYII